MVYQREFEMQALPQTKDDEDEPASSGPLHRLLKSFSRAPPHEDAYSVSSYNTTTYASNGRLFNMGKANYNSANTALARELKNRHLQMIAFGGSIGTGLFVASGVALYRGGPVSLLIAFVAMGTMQFFTMQALGELSVAFPVGGSFSNYSTRFLDPSWGFAMGWNYTLQYLVVLPLEIIAGAFTINYWNPNATKSIFILLFFFLILGINLLGVKGYGEAEFIFSAVKITAIVGFILLGIIINIAGDPEGGYIGFTRWQSPGGFHNGFKGFASVLVTATFSFAGTEMVGLAAAETSNPKKSLPAAVKQVFWRISLFYILSILIIGLLVPYDEPRLLGAKYGSDAAASPFVIAIEMSGSDVLPDIMNAVILISLISVGNTAVYASSRTLAALAEQSLAPKIFAYIDRTGRPLVAIICCGTAGLLAFSANSKVHNEIFNWLLAISGLSTLFTWGSICICHIRFRKAWELSGFTVSQLAFRSQVGVWGSWVALFAYSIVLILQVWVAISPIEPEGQEPFSPAERAKNFFLQVLTIPSKLAMATHSFWQYLRLKTIVTLIRLLNYIGTRSHLKPSTTCNRKAIRLPSRDLGRFIQAWVYYPQNFKEGEKRGLVVNWHGGACMLPNLGMDHEFCEKIANESGVLVLDVDYRKAPEYPFPAAVEDVEDVLRWVESQPRLFDTARVALSGFSSGANLALVASSELRRQFSINIRAVYAFYPGVDFTIPPEQKTVPNPIRPLPAGFQHLLTEAYLPRVEDRKSPRASPMYADATSFPERVVLFPCSGDIFTPEIDAFGEKLEKAGCGVEIVRMEGAHGCDKRINPRTFNPEAKDMSYNKVVENLKSFMLLTTGDYSDLTIICGDDRYEVHKAIVCSRSPFFKRACDGNFEESQTSEVKLPDDDPVAVQMMIEYLYRHTYMPPLPGTHASTLKAELSATASSAKRKQDIEQWGASFVGNKRMKEQDGQPSSKGFSPGAATPATPSSSDPVHPTRQSLFSSATQPTRLSIFGSPSVQLTPNPPLPSANQAPPANLCLHAKVYALGEKYGIWLLKVFALRRFAAEVESHLQSKDFLLAIEEAYASTIEEDRSLRDIIVQTIKMHKYLLKKPSVQAIVKSTQLGYDLLMKFASEEDEK
ncbi:hypothetical protein KAF25_002174 [Fusarium avenaceum]|uniref:BTB domain-containing protein n=1 Tax=Fusarium avenaceum TaxID=40199 RepID=A0A9P7H214_9HYPO|nr:hypothetical protein KAF25_002174 [Fusarium avenaceum]